jgi:hypothetical protein
MKVTMSIPATSQTERKKWRGREVRNPPIVHYLETSLDARYFHYMESISPAYMDILHYAAVSSIHNSYIHLYPPLLQGEHCALYSKKSRMVSEGEAQVAFIESHRREVIKPYVGRQGSSSRLWSLVWKHASRTGFLGIIL